MTKEIELTIKSVQRYPDHQDNDLTTQTTGEYYFRNGCHYIIYEEKQEGFSESIKSMLKLRKDCVEMSRKGLVNTTMIFDQTKETSTVYYTPFGRIQLGIGTKGIRLLESEKMISADVSYSLKADGEHMADCRIKIMAKEKAEE